MSNDVATEHQGHTITNLCDRLNFIFKMANHHIPYYAYGDNEAACDLAHRLQQIAEWSGGFAKAPEGPKHD